MGETNNKVMVRAIAKHADVFNSMPASVEGFRKKLDVVGEACSAIGRDFGSLGLSLETQILVCRKDSEIDACFERMEKLRPRERSDEDILAQMKATNPALESYGSRKDLEKEFLIGTPDVIVDRAERVRGPRSRALHAVVHGFPEYFRHPALFRRSDA